MPFIKISGLGGIDRDVLHVLREDIVSAVIKSMGVEGHTVTVYMPQDLLPPPQSDEEGGNTVLVEVKTGMFGYPLEPEKRDSAAEVVEHVVNVVCNALQGGRDVEGFLASLDGNTKTLKHRVAARPHED